MPWATWDRAPGTGTGVDLHGWRHPPDTIMGERHPEPTGGLTRGVTGEHMSLRQGEWAVAALFAAYALLYGSHVMGWICPLRHSFRTSRVRVR